MDRVLLISFLIEFDHDIFVIETKRPHAKELMTPSPKLGTRVGETCEIYGFWTPKSN